MKAELLTKILPEEGTSFIQYAKALLGRLVIVTINRTEGSIWINL